MIPWEAFANEQPLAVEERPWAQSTSQADQQAASKLFEEGNSLLEDALFVEAIAKYQKALTHWDHPAIHYNLAFALLRLDEPIEAHLRLEAALRYGVEPLDADKFENARTYKALLEAQLSWVELSCDTPGASVSMDGKALFLAPGRYEGFVRPGPHSFVTSKEGHPPTALTQTLVSGERKVLNLRWVPPEELIQYRRRWPAWRPWAAMAAGAAVALGGGVFYMRASETYRDFDNQVTACGGCKAVPHLTDIRARGDTLQGVAFTLYAIGGGALLTGGVLAYVNRLQPYRIHSGEAKGEPQFSIVPLLTQDETGLLTTFRF
jgi:tetratricopeptide (TPR) repeat protein